MRARGGHGNFHVDGGALAGDGFEEEEASEEFGPFANAEEAEVSVVLGFGHALRGEGAAIVADLEVQGAILLQEGKPGAGGGRVLLDVLQGFLGQAEKVGEIFAVEEVDRVGFDADVEGDAGALAENSGLFFQRGGEPEVVEECGAKVAREGADVLQGAFKLVAEVEQFLAEPGGNFFVLGQSDAVRGGGEDLGDIVVEFAADGLLLPLACLDQVLGQGFDFTKVPGAITPKFFAPAPLKDERMLAIRGVLAIGLGSRFGTPR